MSNNFIQEIQDKYGKSSIMTFNDKPQVYKRISTGCFSLDEAIGGGIPEGRIIEVFGPESSGKSTIAQHIVAEAQKLGGTCAYIDVEHSLDPEYAKNIGIDIDKLYITQPDNAEQALDILESLVRSCSISVVVVDSVSALVPQAELDGDMGQSHMGLQARLMSQAMRKLTGIISKSNTIVVFINQIRNKIGVFFGNPETTSGGNALKFYSSIRLDVRKTKQLTEGNEIVGNEVKVKVVKNKVAPPFKIAEFKIMYGEGISVIDDIIDTGLARNILEKKGNTLYFGDIKLGVGRVKAKEALKDQDILNQIKDKISYAK